MTTSINSIPQSTSFARRIEHNSAIPTFMKTNIQSILTPALAILLPETVKDYLIDDNLNDTIQSKREAYFSAIDNARRDNAFIAVNRLLSDENLAPVAKSYYQSRNELLPTAQQLMQEQQILPENSYNSLMVMFNDIQQTIRDAKESYLDCYRDVFKNSMEKFREISGLLSEVSNYVNESSKDNFISLKQQKMLSDLEKLKTKLSQEPDELIYQQEVKFIEHTEGIYQKVGDNSNVLYTKTQALAMMKSYRQSFEQKITGTLIEAPAIDQIDESSLTQGIIIKIKIDIKPLTRVIEVVKNLEQPTKDHLEISQARFNLINTAIDTAKKDYQAMLDEMSQRYNTANANYDNFVKILSSTINAMQDSAKSFLR